MMTSQERYLELLTFTKLYLQQEHASNDRILSEPETYTYFKTYALQNQKNKTQSHQPKQPSIQTQSVAKLPLTEISQVVVNKPFNNNSAVSMPSTSQSTKYEAATDNVISEKSNVVPTAVKAPLNAIVPATQSEKMSDNPRNSTGHVFNLELPAPLKPLDFSNLRKIIHEKLPLMRLVEQFPDDTEAKSLANLWSQEKKIPQVLILSFDENPKHQAFLANIRIALEVIGIDTQVANASKMERDLESDETASIERIKACRRKQLGFLQLAGIAKKLS